MRSTRSRCVGAWDEEKVLERAAQKLRLDQLVIQQGRAQIAAKAAANKDELLSMIQHGAEKVFQTKGATGLLAEKGADLDEQDIDDILAKGEARTKEPSAKYEKLGLDDLQKFTSESAYEWNGEDLRTCAVRLPGRARAAAPTAQRPCSGERDNVAEF